jgi:hypothetical protein
MFRVQLLEAVNGLLLGIERQRWCMFGKAMPVGKTRILFLNVATVRQQDAGQIAGA